MKQMYIILEGGLIQSIMTDAEEAIEVTILDRDLPDTMTDEEYADYQKLEQAFDRAEKSGTLTEIYAG